MRAHILDRLEEKKIIKENGCWEFTGAHSGNGYSQIWYEEKVWLLHRLSIFLFKPAEYKEHLQANHRCDNRGCWNPEHIYMGTQSDNRQDAIDRGQWKNQNSDKKFCHRGHEFTEENTKIYRGHRACRECQRINQQFRRFLR